MQQQPIDTAFTTEECFGNLEFTAEEAKCTLRDVIVSSGQVATTLSVCWMLHLFV